MESGRCGDRAIRLPDRCNPQELLDADTDEGPMAGAGLQSGGSRLLRHTSGLSLTRVSGHADDGSSLGAASVPGAPVPGRARRGEIIGHAGATLRQMDLAWYKARPGEVIRLGIAACSAAGIKVDVDLRLLAL